MAYSKRKIAFFLGALRIGGAESLILDVCKNYDKEQFDICCIYRNEGELSGQMEQTGVRLLKLGRSGSLFKYIWRLRRCILKEGIEIVHTQTISNTIISIIALSFTKVKIIVTFHGFFDSLSDRRLHFVCSHCERIICVSDTERKYYENRLHLEDSSKLITIYNGVNFDKITEACPNIDYLRTDGRIQLAMVGSFVGGRDHLLVAKSILELKNRGVSFFDFFFIGRKDSHEEWVYDNCYDYCQKNGLTHVHFLGERKDVPSLLKAMDGYIYSTKKDTFGIAVIEALAAGLPTVVNDWEVMKEIIRDPNEAVRFFRTGDVIDCADKMQALLSDLTNHKDRLAEDCEIMSERIKEEFSIERHINELSNVYYSVL